MKRLKIFIIAFLLIMLSSFTKQQSPIYQHLGYFNFQHTPNTNAGLSSYVTKHYNNSGSYTSFRYVFYLKMVSTSHNRNVLTSTWLYNTKIYVDGVEVSYQQSPNGFTAYVSTTETLIYSWYTNNENVAYSVVWSNAVYDPRNVR